MDKEGAWDLEGDANTMWNSMANCMRRISREVLGESKGTGPSSRETWWWREESYRLANKEVKKVVRETKLKVYDDLYTRLDSKEGEKRCIKSEDSKVLVKDDEIKERWKNYRGIKLMCHIMKVWERVMEHRLRDITEVSENQFGFMPGRSTMEAIYLLRRVIEKYKEKKRDIHMVNSNNESRGEVKIENQELPKSEHFRYLGSIITTAGEIDADVAHRIKA
ncbi:hypothetical protein CsSME_00037979 [Camellia sinensis var. sinensis]